MVIREISNTVGTREWLSRIVVLWPLNSTRNHVGNLYGSTVWIAWQIVMEDLEKDNCNVSIQVRLVYVQLLQFSNSILLIET